ncbi:MAG TPA: hypothetical protein VIM37_03775 [Candidatus Microsaccharimonas sp.]|jgi:cytoskeletal protein CcmA (bactofilin family)
MKIKLIAVLVLALVLPVLVFASVANAQTFRTGQTATVATAESVDGAAFVGGPSVDVAGKINGDLYCAGQNVTISGEVDGDVICAAQTITVSGLVTGDVRLAGQTISISGDVQGSATVAGQTVTLEGQGKIGRDAVLLGQSISVNGAIARDITITSNNAVIDSAVGRNINAQIENLTLGKNAVIGGAIDYTSPTLLTKDASAQVSGKITYTKQEAPKQDDAYSYSVSGALLSTLMLIVSALLLVFIFPRQLHRTTNASANSVKRTMYALLTGFVASIVVPVAIVILLITVVGIPFAFLILLAWIIISMLSIGFAAYYVGRIVWRTQKNAILIMLIGVLILAIALLIPILDFFVWILVFWYGSGAILLQLRAHLETPRYETTAVLIKKK